ncbi:MAG: RsmE family RNA methyltransferase [Caldilineaceae bacterium]
MHRFFLLESAIHLHQTVDLSPLAHQLQKVLRLAPGALIIVLDNQGDEFDVRITALQHNCAQGEVLAQRCNVAEPATQLTLYQCSLKADKFEWVLQKGTELGVSRFVPVISERSIVRPAATLLKKYARWQAIVREAAEQCGRGRIPNLLAPLDWKAALCDATGLRLLPWETVNQAAPLLTTTIRRSRESGQGIALLIGPEGGISAAEVLRCYRLATCFAWPTNFAGRDQALAAVNLTLSLI